MSFCFHLHSLWEPNTNRKFKHKCNTGPWSDKKPSCLCHTAPQTCRCSSSSLCTPSRPTSAPTSSWRRCSPGPWTTRIRRPPRRDPAHSRKAHQRPPTVVHAKTPTMQAPTLLTPGHVWIENVCVFFLVCPALVTGYIDSTWHRKGHRMEFF